MIALLLIEKALRDTKRNLRLNSLRGFSQGYRKRITTLRNARKAIAQRLERGE